MIPIVSVIGYDKEAKTAAVTALVKEMTGRGYRVGTIKHHVHNDFEIDVPGKASHKHREAGASEVAIASPTMLAYIRTHASDPMLVDVAAMFSPDIDIIITEGYAAADTYKVESPVKNVEAAADAIEKEFLKDKDGG
ncbi:MAG: molybdopterin-guanine dinucleotide biosynthesis protein B [Actinomycetota bacterium]